MKQFKKWVFDGLLAVFILTFFVFVVWLILPKADADGATRALETAGYREIQITGARLWGCSKDDFYRTGFTATGPSGVQTSGVVCGGILKGSTIRTD